MNQAKQVYDEVVRICKEMEAAEPCDEYADDSDWDFFFAQRNAAKEIRILLSHKFPHLCQT